MIPNGCPYVNEMNEKQRSRLYQYVGRNEPLSVQMAGRNVVIGWTDLLAGTRLNSFWEYRRISQRGQVEKQVSHVHWSAVNMS